MAGKEKFDINSQVDKDVTLLSASDANNGLNQSLLRSSEPAAEEGISEKVGGNILQRYLDGAKINHQV